MREQTLLRYRLMICQQRMHRVFWALQQHLTLYTFGINLLECNDIGDITARQNTFNRAKGVFDKLWKDTSEEKPWLQLILQNTIYAFIENQGYTLAEFPYFYRDSRFREALVSNMRYNDIVKNYWRDFRFRSKRLQEAQMEAAHTRIEIIRTRLCYGYCRAKQNDN